MTGKIDEALAAREGGSGDLACPGDAMRRRHPGWLSRLSWSLGLNDDEAEGYAAAACGALEGYGNRDEAMALTSARSCGCSLLTSAARASGGRVLKILATLLTSPEVEEARCTP